MCSYATCLCAFLALVVVGTGTTDAYLPTTLPSRSHYHQQQHQIDIGRPTFLTTSTSLTSTFPNLTPQIITHPKKAPQQQPQSTVPTASSCCSIHGTIFKRYNTSIVPKLLSLLLLYTLGGPMCFNPEPVHAAGYASLSDEQKVVAEAWRLVDNSYLDRTFNHQDWFALRQKYVQQGKYHTMKEAQNAIATMVATLDDRYTRYLSPSQYESLVNTATGTLAGVGLEISQHDTDGSIYASNVQEKSPASIAGIQPGDVFVQVDGVDFTSKVDGIVYTPDDVAVKLRGPVNSRVGVVMMRGNTQYDYIIQRQPIIIQAVKGYKSPSDPKVAVIRIKNFSGTTANTVQQQLNELVQKGSSTDAVVIDCRGNPGGLLPGGVDTAALFLPDNAPVVFVVNSKGVTDAQSTYTTGPYYTNKIPVVVLVDRNTASAAEVFAAALQENDRALLVGEQTFGKGIVQTVRELSDKNGGVAITVARYETPQHHDINKQGIPVDYKTNVDCPKDDAVLCLKSMNDYKNVLFRSSGPVSK